MTGETHRAGGMLISVIGFTMLKNNNMLLPDVNEFLQWLIIYPFCMWGSTASDLDHNWNSCPSKDIPSWFINKALHITEPVYKKLDEKLSGNEKKSSMSYKISKFFCARHRSWQTHSDLTFVSIIFFLYMLVNGRIGIFNAKDTMFLTLILTGVCLGVASHFILDMLTPEGVWNTLVVLINRFIFKGKLPRYFERWHFVPKLRCFATDSKWEDFVCKVLKIATVVSVLYLFAFVIFKEQFNSLISLIPYRIEFM